MAGISACLLSIVGERDEMIMSSMNNALVDGTGMAKAANVFGRWLVWWI